MNKYSDSVHMAPLQCPVVGLLFLGNGVENREDQENSCRESRKGGASRKEYSD